MNIYVLGQFAVFVLTCLIVAWWAVLNDRPWLAALALVGSTVRPEGIVLTGVLLLLLVYHRNYAVVIRWAVLMGLLFFVSLLQIGFWLDDFLDGVQGYQARGRSTHPTELFSNVAFTASFIGLVVAWGIWALWQTKTLSDKTNLLWSLSIIIIVVLLVFPQTKSYTLTYLLLPLWLIIWQNKERWGSLLLASLLLVSPWIYLGLEPVLEQEPPLQQLLMPTLVAAFLTLSWFRWKRQRHVSDSPDQSNESVRLSAGDVHC